LTAFSVTDEFGVLPDRFLATGRDCLAGPALNLLGDVTVVGEEAVNATVLGKYSSAMFPNDWLLCSRTMMSELLGGAEPPYNFAVAKKLDSADIEHLESAGFSVQPTVAIMGFLESSMDEIEDDAAWVLLPSAFVIAVLAYSFIGAETADRRHDIGIIKTLGAGRRRIFGYLLMNAFVISAYGGVFGVALGVVLSYALSTAASAVVSSVFVIETSEMLLVSAFLVTLAAGVVGAVLPALRMTLTSPVQDLRVVTR